MNKLAWLSLACLATIGCTSDEGSTPTDAAVSVDAPPPLGPCPDKTVCLDPFLVTDKPVMAGRLTVIWFQPMRVNGLPPMPVEVGYDVPFEPGKMRYDIPLAQVRAPSRTDLLLCQWEGGFCQTQANPPPIGFGLPVILDDTSGNGRIDIPEITFYGNHGVGMAYFAWSQNNHPLGSPALQYSPTLQTYLGKIFTVGISAGVHGYGLVPGSGFDSKLGPPDSASGADLAICPSQGSSCQVPAPRLVGVDNPG